MSELKERLGRLGELGTPAGAAAVWKRVARRLALPGEARVEPAPRPRARPAPVVVAVSVALVVALLVAGAVALTRTTSRSRSSVIAGPTPSSTHPQPAPPPAIATRAVDDGASTVAELRERRLNTPRLQPGKVCPHADVNLRVDGVGPAVEAGPVATATFSENPALWYGEGHRNGWHRAKVLWLVRADQPKAVIVRGRRIDAPGAVDFYNAGRDSRTYSLAADATSTASPEWRDIPSSVYVRPSGCYALQVDGPDFQSTFVFAARPKGQQNVTNPNPATQGT